MVYLYVITAFKGMTIIYECIKSKKKIRSLIFSRSVCELTNFLQEDQKFSVQLSSVLTE
jgi:hypothetical protein